MTSKSGKKFGCTLPGSASPKTDSKAEEVKVPEKSEAELQAEREAEQKAAVQSLTKRVNKHLKYNCIDKVTADHHATGMLFAV